jgi:hypothetical protein
MGGSGETRVPATAVTYIHTNADAVAAATAAAAAAAIGNGDGNVVYTESVTLGGVAVIRDTRRFVNYGTVYVGSGNVVVANAAVYETTRYDQPRALLC